MTEQFITEYAVQMAGGGMHIRSSDPDLERIYPLAEWIRHCLENGARVYRRRATVVEEWVEVTRTKPLPPA